MSKTSLLWNSCPWSNQLQHFTGWSPSVRMKNPALGEGDLPLGNHHWVLCPPGWLRAGHYIQPRWHHPRPVVSWLSNMTINAGPSWHANSIHFTLSRAALMWDTLVMPLRSNSNGSLLSDWVDLPWIYRFFHRLFCRKRGNSFQMFELPAETVNVPTVRSLVSSQQATWGKKDTFFLFATRGTAPTQHCVSLFSCKRARGILELSPCWKRVGVHHFV